MRRFLTIGCLALAGACNPYAEILAPHAEPGGSIGVTLDQGPLHAAPGLATAKAEPMTIRAQSALVSIGIEAGLDAANVSALTRLAMPSTSITLPISNAGRSQLQVYLGGDGCTATSGTIVLNTDADGKVGGSFEAVGQRSSNQAACALSGTLSVIPVDK